MRSITLRWWSYEARSRTLVGAAPWAIAKQLLVCIVFAVFLLLVSGFGLFMLEQFHKMVVITEAKKLGMLSTAIDNILPFPNKKFVFSLTHIILFAILISILSMSHHPAQDTLVQAEKAKKRNKEEKEGKNE